MTTAGNGPGPSGLPIVTGISSRAPLGAVVIIMRSDAGPAQPASSPASTATTTPPRDPAMMARFYATRTCGREAGSASLAP